jgi:hypothetical protein
MKLPNFFIVGAPKCGTTTLFEQLRRHPSVFMCEPKEPQYFAADFPRYRYVCEWRDYAALFDAAHERHAAVGEASALYLYSQCAIPDLLARFPGARLIVMLRNPVEMATSMHAQVLYDGDEDVEALEGAWNRCSARARGELIPKSCRDAKVLLYDRIARLGFQLQRLLEVAPRENVMWIFREELMEKPAAVYRDVLTFLGLEDDGRTDLPLANTRKERRSQLLLMATGRVLRFTSNPPVWLLRTRRALGLERVGIMGVLEWLNTRPARESGLSREPKVRMLETFRPDIRLLEELTGRNLHHWLE